MKFSKKNNVYAPVTYNRAYTLLRTCTKCLGITFQSDPLESIMHLNKNVMGDY